MSEDGHRYFFGQNPEMPWRKKMKLYVNGKEKEISLRAYNILRNKVIAEDDDMICAMICAKGFLYLCTCRMGHKHPHIAHGSNEDNLPVYAVWLKESNE